MKKILAGALLILAALTMGFVSCASNDSAAESTAAPADETEAAVPTSGEIYSGDFGIDSFTFEDNHTYGKNFQIAKPWLPADYKAQVGDVIKISITGTSDMDMSNMGFNIVDTTQAAGWWTVLTTEVDHDDGVKADQEFAYDMEFDITKDSTTKAESNGCNIVIYTGNDQEKAPTVTLSKFTYSITRP